MAKPDAQSSQEPGQRQPVREATEHGRFIHVECVRRIGDPAFGVTRPDESALARS